MPLRTFPKRACRWSVPPRPRSARHIARALDLVACSSLTARYAHCAARRGALPPDRHARGADRAVLRRDAGAADQRGRRKLQRRLLAGNRDTRAQPAVSSTCTTSPTWSRSLQAASRWGASSSSAWQVPSICFRRKPGVTFEAPRHRPTATAPASPTARLPRWQGSRTSADSGAAHGRSAAPGDRWRSAENLVVSVARPAMVGRFWG